MYKISLLSTYLTIKVLLDLHGAPGFQNGWEHSGRIGKIHWHEGDNPKRTVRILVKVAEMVKAWVDEGAFPLDTFEGLEPVGYLDYIWNTCKDGFYQDGYAAFRTVFPGSRPLVSVSQAIRPYRDFDGLMPDHVGAIIASIIMKYLALILISKL